jgi:hypothetical protein
MTQIHTTVESIFYADVTAGVNIQRRVAEENFSRTPSVIQRKRNVYEPVRVLRTSASAGGKAVDNASFTLGSPHATGAVRSRRTYTQFTRGVKRRGHRAPFSGDPILSRRDRSGSSTMCAGAATQ